MTDAHQIIKEAKQLGDEKIAEHSGRFFKSGPGEYAEGDKFLPLTKTAELFGKGLPKGEKIPKGPFTKMGQTDDFVEVNIADGVEAVLQQYLIKRQKLH